MPCFFISFQANFLFCLFYIHLQKFDIFDKKGFYNYFSGGVTKTKDFSEHSDWVAS